MTAPGSSAFRIAPSFLNSSAERSARSARPSATISRVFTGKKSSMRGQRPRCAPNSWRSKNLRNFFAGCNIVDLEVDQSDTTGSTSTLEIFDSEHRAGTANHTEGSGCRAGAAARFQAGRQRADRGRADVAHYPGGDRIREGYI